MAVGCVTRKRTLYSVPLLRITWSSASVLIALASCTREDRLPAASRGTIASREDSLVTSDSVRLHYRVVGTVTRR